jgi:t-SNARE complex subunit (syntaxin)
VDVDDLVERTARLRFDLQALENRIKELTDAFDLLDSTTEGASREQVIDSLSDARLDLSTADRHLETAVRNAEKLSTD